jgi:hypothetical protein
MATRDPEAVPQIIALKCSCGGTTSVPIAPGAQTAAGECACGKLLLWSDQKAENHVPAVLGLSVGDAAGVTEKLN